MILHSIKITGFYGRKNPISIKFKDNYLICVGENGVGKSTIMKVLCYALTCQFAELNKYEFDTIILSLNNVNITIKKGLLNEFYKKTFEHFFIEMVEHPDADTIRELRHRIPSQLFEEIARDVYFGFCNFSTRYYNAPISTYTLHRCKEEINSFKESYQHYYTPQDSELKSIEDIKTQIKNEIGDVVFLYLPTYRRIEQDVNTIFGVDFERTIANSRSVDNFEKYVEFGMNDVQKVWNDKEKELRDSFNRNNDKIRKEYYVDVLLSKYKNIDREKIKNLTSEDKTKVIKTISEQENILLHQIDESINNLKQETNEDRIDIHDRIVCHFFLKLLDSINTLENKAQIITDYTNVCNKYLINKELTYDSSSFKISINLKNIELQKDKNKIIDLSSLSSGEKQVVSLFCKLYLEGDDEGKNKRYFVLIDEPELSISVGWQRMFLKDVIDSPKCEGLFAVTHSPFIFQGNELKKYRYELDITNKEE